MAAGESALDTTRSLRVYAAQSSSWELRSSGRMRTAVARRCCSCSSRRTVLRRRRCRSRCAPASACSCAILVSGAVSPASCAVIVWKQRQWRWVTMMRPGICVQAALLSHPGTDMIAHLITCLLQPQPPPPRRRWWCQHAAACGLHEHDTEVSAQRNHKVWRQSGGQVDCRPVYVREGASLML